jgi:hypothetical protein
MKSWIIDLLGEIAERYIDFDLNVTSESITILQGLLGMTITDEMRDRLRAIGEITEDEELRKELTQFREDYGIEWEPFLTTTS